MTTDELIRALRTMAAYFVNRREAFVLSKAADRLEELDERVAIMAAECGAKMDEKQ